MIGIYKIINNINNKVYIGQSINIEKRIKEHFWKANNSNDRSFNSILHQAIRKYGSENFTYEVIAECSVEEIDELEHKYIAQYNCISPNGYNILSGGQKNRAIPKVCKLCGAVIDRQSTYCVSCGHKMQRKCDRPTRDELKHKIRNETFVSIAKQYGVADKTICKWCIAYNLPYRKKDIKQYSDEEWEKI